MVPCMLFLEGQKNYEYTLQEVLVNIRELHRNCYDWLMAMTGFLGAQALQQLLTMPPDTTGFESGI